MSDHSSKSSRRTVKLTRQDLKEWKYSPEFQSKFPWIVKVHVLIAAIKQKLLNPKNNDSLKEAEYWRDYWNNKHTKRSVVYRGRTAPNSSRMIDCPVQLFIHPHDPVIKKNIIFFDLTVKDPSKCNDVILKIYKHTRTKPSNPYRYVHDDQNVGLPEFWMFPFELRQVKAGDCDDWGSELASYYIAAGVPSWRIRCVVGNTWSGGGHYTVYVLGDDFRTWYHTNSTTSISDIKATKLTDLPASKDPTDRIGIRDVWFSFNDEFAWHDFEATIKAKGIKII